MIDLGRMNLDLTTDSDEQIIKSMQNSIAGKDITNAFFSEPQRQEVKEPVVDFNKWNTRYLQQGVQQPVAEVQQPVQQEAPMQFVNQNIPTEKKSDEFNFDEWLSGVNGNSVSNNQSVEPVQAVSQQPTQAPKAESKPIPDINEIMNRSYNVLGQFAQSKGYNPYEVVDLAKNITPEDMIDLYELKKQRELTRSTKPNPGISIAGDPSNYKQQNKNTFSIAGIGASNVRI